MNIDVFDSVAIKARINKDVKLKLLYLSSCEHADKLREL